MSKDDNAEKKSLLRNVIKKSAFVLIIVLVTIFIVKVRIDRAKYEEQIRDKKDLAADTSFNEDDASNIEEDKDEEIIDEEQSSEDDEDQEKDSVTTTTNKVTTNTKKPSSTTNNNSNQEPIVTEPVPSTPAPTPEPLPADTTPPTIIGVLEGQVNSSFTLSAIDNQTPTQELTATIDGINYEFNTIYDKNGDHTLIVKDKAGNSTTVHFTVANTITDTASLVDMISTSDDGDIIILDGILSEPCIINKSITLRGTKNSRIESNITIENNVTLENIAFDYSEEDSIIVEKELTLTSININATNNTGTSPIILNSDSSVVTLNNSAITQNSKGTTDNFSDAAMGITVSENVSNSVIEINNSTIQMTGTYSRAIAYFGKNQNSKIIMNNSNILNNNNPSKGISLYDQDNFSLTMNSSKIEGSYYALNVGTNVTNSNFEISNSTIAGWAALDIWGRDNVFKINNSILKGTNNAPYSIDGNNDFSTIITNKSEECVNNTIDLSATQVIFERNGEDKGYQYAAFIYGTNNTLTMDENSSLYQIHSNVENMILSTKSNHINISDNTAIYIDGVKQ